MSTTFQRLPDHTDLDELSLPELERFVSGHAALVASETAEYLRLLAAFDRREGWRGDGVRSCAHWLNWKVGTNLRTAHEQLRVGRCLDGLPLTAAAFREGRLTYSRVRAITRVASPTNEAGLVERALVCTGAQLEQIVRAYEQMRRLDDDTPPPAPECRLRQPSDDQCVLTVKASPADIELIWRAIHAAMTFDEERPVDERRADALVAIADSYLANGPVDRSGADRTHIVIHEHHASDPATAPSPSVPRNADDASVQRDADNERVPRNTESTDITDGPTPDGMVSAHLDEDSVPRNAASTADPLVRAHLDDGTPLTRAEHDRLTSDAATIEITNGPDGEPTIGRKSSGISARLRRQLNERDNNRCQWPGCSARHHLHAHHVIHRAHGGPTILSNLVLLCGHHHRILHQAGYHLRRTHGEWQAVRPDGTIVDPRPIIVSVPRNTRHPNTPPPHRPITRWTGEPLDTTQLNPLDD